MLAILNLHDHSHVAWCQQQIKPGQSLRNSMALGRVICQKTSTWVYAFLAFATSPSLHNIKTHGVMETGSMEAESSWVMEAGSIWEYQQIKLKTSQNNALNEEHDILILQTMRKKKRQQSNQPSLWCSQMQLLLAGKKKQKTGCGRLI